MWLLGDAITPELIPAGSLKLESPLEVRRLWLRLVSYGAAAKFGGSL
jgi:hypothetical protein